ncbi:MAG: aa3-type cytochrome c oxidase subunit IV [Enhydrobacter sp.]|nr:aa3-type cytochrome c oxidase subunit IV [Enhydrobacter sp.]
MAEASSAEYRAHLDTYTSFNKLVLFTVLWVVLLLVSMALGLIANAGFLSVVLGVGGTIALLVAFAMLS